MTQVVHATDCATGLLSSTCDVTSTGGYIYSAEYNNKKSNPQSNVTTSADDLTQVTLPAGYYESTKINWTSAELTSTNFKAGLTFFGSILGDRPAADPSALCSIASSTASDPSTCKIPATKWFYKDILGGRDDCTITATGNSNIFTVSDATENVPGCWLNMSNANLTGLGSYTLKSSSTPPNCSSAFNSVTGKITKGCLPDTLAVGANPWIAYTNKCGSNISVLANETKACYIETPTIADPGNNCSPGENTSLCKAAVNSYVYKTQNGGRTLCTNNSAGNCYLGDGSVANSDNYFKQLDANLVPENILTGKVILGVTGTMVVTPITWASGAQRAYVAGKEQLNYIDFNGTAGNSNLNPALWVTTHSNYRPVPVLDVNISSTKINRKFDRTGLLDCGTTGDIATRIADCATQNPTKKTDFAGPPAYSVVLWDGSTEGNAGQGKWALVAKSGSSEIWKDLETNLFWSEVVSTSASWCKAAGKHYYNGTASPPVGYENDPEDLCDNPSTSTVQDQSNPISLCFEASGLTTPGTGKVGITKNSTDAKIIWRLPTMHDYILANHHGLRAVIADRSSGGTVNWREWTATVSTENRSDAWLMNMRNGTRLRDKRSYVNMVRCVGRLPTP